LEQKKQSLEYPADGNDARDSMKPVCLVGVFSSWTRARRAGQRIKLLQWMRLPGAEKGALQPPHSRQKNLGPKILSIGSYVFALDFFA